MAHTLRSLPPTLTMSPSTSYTAITMTVHDHRQPIFPQYMSSSQFHTGRKQIARVYSQWPATPTSSQKPTPKFITSPGIQNTTTYGTNNVTFVKNGPLGRSQRTYYGYSVKVRRCFTRRQSTRHKVAICG